MENYVSIKLCPICGEVPEKTTRSLEGPNGRGYRGCFTYQYKCECCKLIKGTEVSDVYEPADKAQNRAKTEWNVEVERVQSLLDRLYVPKALVENNVI
jgi:hypothetical protein